MIYLSEKRLKRPVIPDYYVGPLHFLFNWDLGPDNSCCSGRIESAIITKTFHLR